MKTHTFKLLPFEMHSNTADYQIGGAVMRSNGTLILDFVLTGALNGIVLPLPVKVPLRKDRLWEGTCFECFIGMKNDSRYWEINISPSGHWNVYSFDAYRTNMQIEPAFEKLDTETERGPDRFKLSCRVALAPIDLSMQQIRMGLSAIIQSKDNEIIHWALTHTGLKPDFHRDDTFILSL